MFEERILAFGEKFRGRLDEVMLEGALDYINYNEEWLAFDTLCTHLSEYNISISAEEFNEAAELVSDMALSMINPPFKYLESLVAK